MRDFLIISGEEPTTHTRSLREEIHRVIGDPINPQLRSEPHTSQTPPHSIVCARDRTIYSQIEFSVPVVRTLTTPDPSQDSDWTVTPPESPPRLNISDISTPSTLSPFSITPSFTSPPSPAIMSTAFEKSNADILKEEQQNFFTQGGSLTNQPEATGSHFVAHAPYQQAPQHDVQQLADSPIPLQTNQPGVNPITYAPIQSYNQSPGASGGIG